MSNVIIDNPTYNRRTTIYPVCVASDIGAVNDTWKTQGGLAYNTSGYNYAAIYIEMTVNDSTGNQLQVLTGEDSSSVTRVLPVSSEYQYTLGNSDITDGIVLSFNLSNVVNYIKIQTKATDVDTGGGTIGTISINLQLGY